MAKRPEVGDPAPDFKLDGTEGRFRLSDRRGERVVLLFYPGDNTAVCTRQFCSYRDQPEAFAGLGATVVGISSQSVESHAEFRDRHNLTVPLLADNDGAVAKAYGARRPIGGTNRVVVIVDEEGIVRYRHDPVVGLSYQTVEDLREALDSLPARPSD
ncbi:MAG: peroxiredoxin [Thermoleophilaceae bacterium]|nr:peroxiredoxin [Thermoleophilaceae bacterium]